MLSTSPDGRPEEEQTFTGIWIGRRPSPLVAGIDAPLTLALSKRTRHRARCRPSLSAPRFQLVALEALFIVSWRRANQAAEPLTLRDVGRPCPAANTAPDQLKTQDDVMPWRRSHSRGSVTAGSGSFDLLAEAVAVEVLDCREAAADRDCARLPASATAVAEPDCGDAWFTSAPASPLFPTAPRAPTRSLELGSAVTREVTSDKKAASTNIFLCSFIATPPG